MAFWKRRNRGSFAPSSHDRVAVNYLGRHPVVDNTDLEHTATPLDILYRNYKDGKEHAQRVTVEVIVNGLVISMLKGFSPPSESSASFGNRTIMPASKMYVGATDPARPKIFFVVKRRDDDETGDTGGKYECHAFLCDTPAIANSLTMQLMETFNHSGDDETKLAYRRSSDMMLRSSQQQASLDKVLSRSQSLNLPRSRGRQEPVSTLKVTMNVDHGFKNSNEGNNNSEIARILAKRDGDQAPGAADYSMEGYFNKIDTESPKITTTTDEGSPATIPPDTNEPAVTFNPTQPDSPPRLLRESQQLSSVKEQSPQSSPKLSPKQSPKENPRNTNISENTKENQEVSVQKEQEDARKLKSVRFADDPEVI